jgi:hypothetical protein
MYGARPHGPDIKVPKQPDEIISHDEFRPHRSITRLHIWELAERERRGAEGLARRLGVTARTIFRWIHGRQATYKNRLRMHGRISELLEEALID